MKLTLMPQPAEMWLLMAIRTERAKRGIEALTSSGETGRVNVILPHILLLQLLR